MRFWEFKLGLVLSVVLGIFSLWGCSTSDTEEKITGIEVGNPSIALTANFSVDYSEVQVPVFLKKASQNEKVLIDDLSLSLYQLRSYSSYYVAVSIDVASGLQIWPEEDSEVSALDISFTEESLVEEPFKNVDLQDEGYLKEMGVAFKPKGKNSIVSGQLLLNDEYVPFEYSIDEIKNFELRYHYSQIEHVSDTIVNLSVMFYANYFIDSIDFSNVNVSLDGKIYFNEENNVEIWNEMNERFVPSFRPLRYSYIEASGKSVSNYVLDIWEGIIGRMADNTISNGDFSNELNDWIFFTQFEGKGSAVVKSEKNGNHYAEIQVTQGGTKSYSVQLLQENVALLAGKKYKCIFTIWSDNEGPITARIGKYDDYETIGFQEHVFVGKNGKSVEIEFTPKESTPFARFELNLGGQVRKFYVKDVKVFRLQE